MAEKRVLDKSHDQPIRGFLKRCDQATIYHTPEWRDALVASYGYQPIYLGYLDEGQLTALFPMMLVKSWLTGTRLVSLPFSNVCGPIGRPEHVEILLGDALRVYHETGAKALEIRTQANKNPIDDRRFADVSYFITSIVRLDPDPERVWKSFKDRNVRTEVRQAAKKGIQVRPGTDENDLKRFYSLFAASRLRHGVPPQPYGFFVNLWRHLFPRHLDLLIATHQDRPVGALITLGWGSTLCAAYIGSDIAFRSHRVDQILFWKAMEMGCTRGYEAFDFLRTPKRSSSLRYFKERWNAFEVDLDYLYYPEIRGTASTIEETTKYILMTHVLKRSPVFFGRLLGRALYRHLG